MRIIPIVLSIALLLGVCIAHVRGQPDPRVATSRHSVVARSALGARVSVLNVSRCSPNDVEFALRLDSRPRGAKTMAVEVGATTINGRSVVTTTETGPTFVDVTGSARVPPSVRRISIRQQVRLARQNHYTFRGISTNTKPVTRRMGDSEVTIRRVYPNRTVDPKRWEYSQQLAGRFFALEIEVKPAGIAQSQSHYSAARNSAMVYSSGSYTDRSDHEARLRDDRGRTQVVQVTSYDIRAVNAESTAFNKAVGHTTNAEKAVSRAAPRVAGTMVDRRASTAAKAAVGRDIYLYAFPVITPTPKEFNLEVTVTLPPGPKHTAWVTFNNVPIAR